MGDKLTYEEMEQLELIARGRRTNETLPHRKDLLAALIRKGYAEAAGVAVRETARGLIALGRISKPMNCQEAGERQFTFELDVDGRHVYGHITWEAVTGQQSRKVTREEMDAALDVLKLDTHGDVAHAVAEHLRKGETGDKGLPISLSSLDFPTK
jgi:hypothetical protein